MFPNYPLQDELFTVSFTVVFRQDSLLHDTIAKFVKMDGAKEEVTVKGSLLNKAGIHLAQTFAGTGYNPGTEVYRDYDVRVYYLEEMR